MSYSITNIEYGIGPWGTEWLYGMVGNPKPGEEENNVHSVTLLQGEGRNILVDTGIAASNPAKKALWDSLITECNGVEWALEQVNLKPEDIDTVILTHAHIDHVGGMEVMTNAHFYIQQAEFEAWEKMTTQPEYQQLTLPAAFPPDYPVIRKMIDEGRVTLLNGDVTNLLPGIDIHVVYNCHSVAEQIVVVNNGENEGETTKVKVANEAGHVVETELTSGSSERKVKYLIAGDVACRPANLVGMGDWHAFLIPILGRSGSARNVAETYQWILDQIHGDMSRLVLTHDVTMTDRFESEPLDDLLHIHYVVK